MTNPSLSSWSPDLPANIMLDSGVMYVGSAVFASTEGGIKYEPGATRRQMPFDGARSPIVGLDRNIEYRPVITATLMEIPQTIFSHIEPGATTVVRTGGPAGATQIGPKIVGTMFAAGDYITNLRAVWQRGDGTYFQVRFPKALCLKWDITGRDKEEVKYACSFEARLDLSVSGALTTDAPVVYEYFATPP